MSKKILNKYISFIKNENDEYKKSIKINNLYLQLSIFFQFLASGFLMTSLIMISNTAAGYNIVATSFMFIFFAISIIAAITLMIFNFLNVKNDLKLYETKNKFTKQIYLLSQIGTIVFIIIPFVLLILLNIKKQ